MIFPLRYWYLAYSWRHDSVLSYCSREMMGLSIWSESWSEWKTSCNSRHWQNEGQTGWDMR